MMEIVSEHDIVCNVCGKRLEADQQGFEIIVDPCETCMNSAYDEGIVEGESEFEGE